MPISKAAEEDLTLALEDAIKLCQVQMAAADERTAEALDADQARRAALDRVHWLIAKLHLREAQARRAGAD